MKKIIYTRSSDGGLSVVTAAPKKQLERVFGHMNDEEYETLVWSRSVPEGAINPVFIEDDAIPDDRYFRDAWRAEDGGIGVDIEKAREIHRNKLRKKRAAILEDYDLLYMIADESGDRAAKQDIANKKRALRDITVHPDIAAARTAEELKLAAVEALEELKHQ